MDFLYKSIKKSGSIGTLVCVFAFVANESEEYRIVSAIKNGELRPKQGTILFEEYNSATSQFSSKEISDVVRDCPSRFCALVGVNNTGKSTELHKFSLDTNNKNIIFCGVNGKESTDLDDILFDTMHKSVPRMPWFLYHIALPRLSKRDMNERILRTVLEETKEPVTIVIDIALERVLSMSADKSYFESVTTTVGAGATTMGLTLNPKQFIKQIKHYVSDARLARCLFGSSEGFMFEELGRVSGFEPRLTVILANELSVEIARRYLETLGTGIYKDEDLTLFPRTFANLKSFANALDKEAFVEQSMEAQVAKVRESFKCVRDPWTPFVPHPVERLYHTALTRKIDLKDISDTCGLTKEQFVTHFVMTNIFQQTETGTYQLQFECTRHAALSVMTVKGWLWQTIVYLTGNG
jgi:hypothetical protein